MTQPRPSLTESEVKILAWVAQRGGDIHELDAERYSFLYRTMCKIHGLDELATPFEKLKAPSRDNQARVVIYLNARGADALRRERGISVRITARERHEDVYVVTVEGTGPDGRVDSAIGAAALERTDYKTGEIKRFSGDALANALMMAETRAIRRLTLAMCGFADPDAYASTSEAAETAEAVA